MVRQSPAIVRNHFNLVRSVHSYPLHTGRTSLPSSSRCMNLLYDPGYRLTDPDSHYTGCPDPKAAPLVLVGKGITFDSGGISLKPSAVSSGTSC